MGVNIEGDCVVLALLNIELLDAIFTKDAEDTTSRILSWDLNNIVLRHP